MGVAVRHVGLIDRAVLDGCDRVRPQSLVDLSRLIDHGACSGVCGQNIRAGSGIDRSSHVELGGHREIDRRCDVEKNIHVDVEIEDRDDLLVR